MRQDGAVLSEVFILWEGGILPEWEYAPDESDDADDAVPIGVYARIDLARLAKELTYWKYPGIRDRGHVLVVASATVDSVNWADGFVTMGGVGDA